MREVCDLSQTTLDAMDAIELSHPAKLVVLNVGATAELLQPTAAAEKQLAIILSSIRHNWLHPCGTLALRVPHPWFIHSGRLYGACDGSYIWS